MSTLNKTRSLKLKVHDHIWYAFKHVEVLQSVVPISENTNSANKVRLPPGYINSDGVSCYANAVCQCIFSYDVNAGIISTTRNGSVILSILK